jgi:hypothetical protein
VPGLIAEGDALFHKQSLSKAAVLNDGSAQMWIRRLALLWEQPIWGALQALLIYGIFAVVHGNWWSVSQNGYFNYLADAFLHGQLHLRIIPPVTYDLSLYHGRYYLYWPPLPALVLLPFVALFGIQFSDTLLNLAIGALNVAVVASLLRQACIHRVIKLSRVRRGLLVLCFALGTVHLTLAPFGRVWNTGQLIGFLCVALCYLVILRFRGMPAFVLAGLALAAALFTRNHLVFAGLWPACYLLYRHRSLGLRRLSIYTMLGILPIVAAVFLLGLYNWLRFQSVSDNGLAYHYMALLFVSDYATYGAFSLHYLPANIFYQYLAYPLPFREMSFMGGSLFLLTPIFAAAGVGIARMQPRWSMWSLLGSICLVAVPILLLMGTGWVQFGPRYTLDFTIPLLLLTAAGLRRWPIHLLALLILISIVHYVLGTMHLALYFL